jgi:hypothetical protein
MNGTDPPPRREHWLLRVELPTDVPNPGRFMARVLKHLLRAWGVRATAILEAPPDPPHKSADATPDAS